MAFFSFFFFLSNSKFEIEQVFKGEIFFLNKETFSNYFKAYHRILKWILSKYINFFPENIIFCFDFSKFKKFPRKKWKFLFYSKKKNITKKALKKIKELNYCCVSSFLGRVKLKKSKIFFWEILMKICCWVPKTFFMKSSYGEETLDFNQSTENPKDFLFIKNYFPIKPVQAFFEFSLIMKLKCEVFFCSSEHIFSEIKEKFSRFFYQLFLKIFLKPKLEKQRKKTTIKKRFKKKKTMFFLFNEIQKFLLGKKKLFFLRFFKKEENDQAFNLNIRGSFKHRFGIFNEKKLKKMTLLIEYKGEIFDQFMENYVELLYISNQIDLFLFRLSDQSLLDATVKGNCCRLINHCCTSNCFTRIIFHGEKRHIMVISSQKLFQLEEVSYNYLIFSEELDQTLTCCNCKEFFCKGDLNK